jgi:hypothetical protein
MKDTEKSGNSTKTVESLTLSRSYKSLTFLFRVSDEIPWSDFDTRQGILRTSRSANHEVHDEVGGFISRSDVSRDSPIFASIILNHSRVEKVLGIGTNRNWVQSSFPRELMPSLFNVTSLHETINPCESLRRDWLMVDLKNVALCNYLHNV